MPVPDFQSMMLPILLHMQDGHEIHVRDLTDAIAEHFGMSAEDRQIMLPSGHQSVLTNRVAWAKAHLKNAGLIDNPTRGRVRIADAGLRALAKKPAAIDCRFLKQFPSYWRFIGGSPEDAAAASAIAEVVTIESKETPQELIENSFRSLRQATSESLLERLHECSSGFFEVVVVRFLQALGYGATGEALVTGKSGDGGVDGIIKEDKLGLDIVCVQAKRWEGTVGRPVIQAFVGSMDFVRAKKGVVITTSAFSKDAKDFVDRIEGKKVVLIDGPTLAGMMIEYDVGVTVTKQYALKEVSNDFFDEDEG